MEKTNTRKVSQNNNFTVAAYDFTANQKNIVYYVLDAIRNDLWKETLFNERIIYLDRKLLRKYKQDTVRLKNDLKILQKTTITFKDETGGTYITGILSAAYIHPRNKDAELHVSKPFIMLAKHYGKNFTSYQMSVVLTLKGTHAKRIYEICCMRKNLGEYRLSLLELKKMLCVENKYKLQTGFENYVLKPAQKRINECEQAEILFDYEFEKRNREVFVVLKIKDKKKQAEKRKLMQSWGKETPVPKMNQACSILNELFSEKHRFYEIFEDLKKAGQIPDFIMKHHQKRQYYEKIGIKETEFKKIMTYILKNDFGIDLKNYRQEGVGIKNRPKPKTLKGQINFLRK